MPADLPWWKDGLYFSCTGCARCCGGEPGTVRFTDGERAAMASALGLTEETFERLCVWRKYGRPSLREKPNYDCVLLDSGRCLIYDVRPSQCRTFPFWHEVLKSKLSWDFYSQTCPGMNRGVFHDYSEIVSCLT
jgi:Fe-S-cluster containining protein